MASLNKDDLLKIKKELSIEPHIEPKYSKIFFDGKQYNVRIPTRIARTLGIKPNKDLICFKVEMNPDIRIKPKLTAELIRG